VVPTGQQRTPPGTYSAAAAIWMLTLGERDFHPLTRYFLTSHFSRSLHWVAWFLSHRFYYQSSIILSLISAIVALYLPAHYPERTLPLLTLLLPQAPSYILVMSLSAQDEKQDRQSTQKKSKPPSCSTGFACAPSLGPSDISAQVVMPHSYGSSWDKTDIEAEYYDKEATILGERVLSTLTTRT